MQDGTAGPGTAPDAFLTTWEQTTSSTVHISKSSPPTPAPGAPPPTVGPYDRVELHNFTFLGARFLPASYVGRQDNAAGAIVPGTSHTGAGVCQEMATLLQRAQRDIFRAYAAEASSKGATASEAGFRQWCGVGGIGGWQFRGGEHARGSAIDIDSGYNPYIVTQTGNVFGGEEYKNRPPREPSVPHNHPKLASTTPLAAPATAAKGVRPRVIDIYQRAWALRPPEVGPLDVSCFRGNNAGESVGDAYDRFLKLHWTLVGYFDLAFTPHPNVSIATNESATLRRFDRFVERTQMYTGIFFRPFPTGNAALQTIYQGIQDDYAVIRLGMVSGNLTHATGAGYLGSGLNLARSRDPRKGILRLRKEIVVGLRQHLDRWGAIDFGAAASGDIMHFDRGRGATVATTSEPNPNNIFYVGTG